MTELEMVELYRGYVFNRSGCITPEYISSECLKNHTNMYRVAFESIGVTLEKVENVASNYAKTIAEHLFNAMFETAVDKTAFILQCTSSPSVWEQNGNDKLCGMLKINGGNTIGDMPAFIHVMDDRVKIIWGCGLPERDRALGPAIVDIKADKSFVGHHVMGGKKVPGYSNWRKRCAKHNLWIAHLTQQTQ